MNDLLLFSLTFPNISAQRLYAALDSMNSSGALRNVSYEAIAVSATALGLRTERGTFTRRTVASRLNDLVRAGLATIEKLSNGLFNVALVRPLLNVVEGAVPETTSATTPAGDEASVHNANISASNSFSETSSDNEIDVKGAPVVPARTVNDVCADVDLTRPKIAAFRRKLARDVYEPGLHSDLVDRAVVAIVKGFATIGDLKSAIREAKDEQHLLKTTNGLKGKRHVWETFCRRVKDWYDGAGVVWVSTSPRRELKPQPLIQNADAADEDERTAHILAADAAIKRKLTLRPMKRF